MMSINKIAFKNLLIAMSFLSSVTTLGATFIVNTNDDTDDGSCTAMHCSFREAINAANSVPGHDEIKFSQGFTIKPQTYLPLIEEELDIDGRAPTGAPSVELSGEDLVPGVLIESCVDQSGDALSLCYSTPIERTHIRGLVIHSFPGYSIRVGAENVHIAGNYLGVDRTGTINKPTGYSNIITVGGGPVDLIIGIDMGPDPDNPDDNFIDVKDKNVLGGFNKLGADLDQDDVNAGNIILFTNEEDTVTVAGNHIGVDVTGKKELPSPQPNTIDPHGIYTNGKTWIGGIDPQRGDVGPQPHYPANRLANVIGGVPSHACIELLAITFENFPPAEVRDGVFHKVIGNYIGTDVTGKINFGCTQGIDSVLGSNLLVHANAIANHDVGVTLELGPGRTELTNNVVYGSRLFGVYTGNPGPNTIGDNQIVGNKIGLNLQGKKRGNGGAGIHLASTLTPTDPENPRSAFLLEFLPEFINQRAMKNGLIKSNIITNTDGPGILLGSDLDPDDGIDGSVKGYTITKNSIYNNSSIGIDLAKSDSFMPDPCDPSGWICNLGLTYMMSAPDGITKNDKLDADDGANNLQNYPVIKTAKYHGKHVNVKAKLKTEPNKSYRVEFFLNRVKDREGRYFVGSTQVTTNHKGKVNFNDKFKVPKHAPHRAWLTSTATECIEQDCENLGSTSEFSKPKKVSGKLKKHNKHHYYSHDKKHNYHYNKY